MIPEPPLPEFVGRYQIVRLLGSGGMGDVYLARDPNIDRLLAVKTVRLVDAGLRDSEERKARLLREARAAGMLMHTHVVTLFDAGEAEGMLYLAFELVEGPDLSERLKSGTPLSLGDTLRLARQVASALEYAHNAGIVHRDIKPGNILIGRGGVAKVADFGIAKLMDQSTDLTRTGSVVGSPQYMSPEQIRGEVLDGRSDIFSLGVVLYELLTSSRPFDGESLSTLVFQILSQMPEPIDALRPGLPPQLVELVGRMLAKDCGERLASATELVAELKTLERELPAEVMAQLVYLPPGETRETSVMTSGAATGATVARAVGPPAVVVPPPPPGAPASAPRASPSAPLPASSLPPSPVPDVVATGTEQSQVAAETVGSYSSRRVPWRLAVIGMVALAGVVAGAWWLGQRAGGQQPSVTAAPALSEAGIGGSEAPVENPPADYEVASPSAEWTGQDSPTTEEPSAEEQQEATEELRLADQPPPTHPEPIGAPPPRQQAAPPPTQVVRSEPAVSAPSIDPVTAPPPSRQPIDGSDEPSPEDLFDQRIGAVDQRLKSGLYLRLQIEPEEAFVNLLRRGENHGIVKGRAYEFDPRKKRSRPLELPFEGRYLLTLKHNGLPDRTVLIDASQANGNTPRVVRASLGGTAAGLGSRPPAKARSLAFSGFPAGSVVFVDGQRVGETDRWPGGGRPTGPRNLVLQPGIHEVRIEVPGRSPLVRRVEYKRSGRQMIRYPGS